MVSTSSMRVQAVCSNVNSIEDKSKLHDLGSGGDDILRRHDRDYDGA